MFGEKEKGEGLDFRREKIKNELPQGLQLSDLGTKLFGILPWEN
jgi:hypothetical protein